MKLKTMLISMEHLNNVPVPNIEPIVNIVDEPTPVVPNIDVDAIRASIDESKNETIEALKEFLKQPNVVQMSEAEEDTILGDAEINEVMSTLLEFQEKYFADIPLSKDLVRKFVWNIPQNVFDAHMEVKDYGLDVLDPLICLYALLTEDPMYTMGVYMKILNEISNKDINYITENSEEYYKLLDEEEE